MGTCENKAVAILERMQAGRPALIKKDGREMLIAIVLDRSLAEAKALVEAPNAFIQAVTKIMQDKQNHPVIAQMINPEVNDDPFFPSNAFMASARSLHTFNRGKQLNCNLHAGLSTSRKPQKCW